MAFYCPKLSCNPFQIAIDLNDEQFHLGIYILI